MEKPEIKIPKFQVEAKNYTRFSYSEYVKDDKVIEKPADTTYEVGDVVTLFNKCEDPATLTIGVVLGVIDDFRQEVRTDTDGMVCFSECRHTTLEDLLASNVRLTDKLRREIEIKYFETM
jgi:hypothetical protein